MAVKKEVVVEKEYPVVFVSEKGDELHARDEIQAAAFEKAGLKVKE